MKIAVKDLEPNPFRQMSKYPIDRVKVKALKISIKEKTFWDNILARPHPKDRAAVLINDLYRGINKSGHKLQLAYGHHRWVALKELKIKEIDIPVRDIDDATMIQIMAEENLDWRTSPAVIIQTVQAAKEYLDSELAKYETWAVAKKVGIFAHLFQNRTTKDGKPISPRAAFGQAKGEQGVGRRTLLKFLGGNWKHWVVRYATEILNDETVNRDAVFQIPTMRQAKSFKEAVKIHKTSLPNQEKIAKTIAKEDVGFRDIPDLVADHASLPAIRTKPKFKSIPNVMEFLNKCETDTDNLNRRLGNIIPELDALIEKKHLLGRLVSALKPLSKSAGKIITEYEKEKKRKDSAICATEE